jgi:hypothetical protein
LITDKEESFILKHAYIPEHVPSYVTSISNSEPHLISNYLYYHIRKHVIFVGYPLGESFNESKLKKSLDIAIEEFKPDSVALISPISLFSPPTCTLSSSDDYFRLELGALKIRKKVRNMIKRASTELTVERSRNVNREHKHLISKFLETHEVDEAITHILGKIPKYVSNSPTSFVLNVCDENGNLVAFDVVELASEEYAFYQFNFVSKENYVPGASDLLFKEIVKIAREKGKKYINMGLGINEGVRRFKKKWGGKPFLKHEFCQYNTKGPDFTGMLDELF